MKSFPSIQIFDTRIDILTLDQLMDAILEAICNGEKVIVSNVNIHALNISYQDSQFRAFLNKSDIVFCDGIGVKLAAGFLGLPVPHRYTPPDWFSLLCKISSSTGYSTFLLGSKPGITEKVKEILTCTDPVIISGMRNGYFSKEKETLDNKEVVNLINQAKPAILAVGFGMPMQERWIDENIKDLNANVFLSVGAMFDYLAGSVYRAPRWVTDNGLEWLARLFVEPRRLWKRYLIGNPLFCWRIFKQRLGVSKPTTARLTEVDQ
jgi:N-acetylglucosaminyldiphosphoundecaprenol N-acetyl-beta-D-mannosaminyltransferase